MLNPECKVGYVETKNVMTKSNAPLGGYAVNPYVGCTHGCKYCYASFMMACHQGFKEVCRAESHHRYGYRRISPAGGDLWQNQKDPGRTERQRRGYPDLHKVGSGSSGPGPSEGDQSEEYADGILVSQHTGRRLL